MDLNLLRGLITLFFLIVFLGIVAYAWSNKNKGRFDEAAMLPLNEPNEKKNG
ncbi:MAG: cbb3-type cytochrome c oxidase subunit 3 [Lautropia sp.]|nr:cbb3-type cytochrome c oxidase subunit 3 [Lautropia sp.]